MDEEMSTDAESTYSDTENSFTFSQPNVLDDESLVNQAQSDTFSKSPFTFARPHDVKEEDSDSYTLLFNHNEEIKINPFLAPKPVAASVFANKVKKSAIMNRLDSAATNVFANGSKKSDTSYKLERSSKCQNVKLDITKSITCTNVPDPLLIRPVAKDHFKQFGEIQKIVIRTLKKLITVYFVTKEAARKAYNENSYEGEKYDVEWTVASATNKRKETVKNKVSSILNVSDDVKEELEAMRGLEYNLPEPTNLKSLAAAAKAKIKQAKIVANRSLKSNNNNNQNLIKKAIIDIEKVEKVDNEIAPKSSVALPKNIPDIGVSLSTIQELQTLIKQPAFSSEEKYKVLDARDRLLRTKRGKPKTLASAKVTKGTCPDMCPEKERLMREFQRQVSIYEQAEGTEYKINHNTAVKQYSRSSADQEEPMPHDLRPVSTLQMTMSYLLHEIADLCESEDVNLAEWYHFLWDRTRGIRKDITQQELCCLSSVDLVEQCARFHIVCSERLCAEEVAVFDPKINSENLTKCLQTLKYMYDDLRDKGIACKNEPEFRTYVILLNLNNENFISELRTLPESVQHSPQIKFALEAYSAIALNNYSKFFKLVRKTTFLNACLLLRYFHQVRVRALSIMVKAYCRTTGTTDYPLYELIDILGFEDEDEAFDFCSQVGLKCDKTELYVKLNRENFSVQNISFDNVRAYNLVQSKMVALNWSIGQSIAGGTMPKKLYEGHVPHSSFDSRGFLLRPSHNAEDQNCKEIDTCIETKTNNENPFLKKPASLKHDKILKGKSIANDIKKETHGNFNQNYNEVFNSDKIDGSTSNKCFIFGKSIPRSLPKSGTIPQQTQSIFQISARPVTPVFSTSSFVKSGNSNMFAKPAVENIFKAPVQFASSENKKNQLSIKRSLEDPEEVLKNKKKNPVSLPEIIENQVPAIPNKVNLMSEPKPKLSMEVLVANSESLYTCIENEVIKEICDSVVLAEIKKHELMESLSNTIYDNIFQEICSSILDEQLFIQDMLIEVSKRLRDKIIIKYYRRWKDWAIKKRTQRREALDNTPVWLQAESIEECAKQLHTPKQIIKSYTSTKKQICEDQIVKQQNAPIEYIINVGLKENAKSFDIDFKSSIFWKIVISWPVLDRRINLWRHKVMINRYLSPEDPNLEPVLKIHKPNPIETLHISIRHFESLMCENFLTGMDALLFVISSDEDLGTIENRLTKTILSREKLMPIPLIIVVFNFKEINLPESAIASLVEKFVDSSHISEYSIIYEKSLDHNVVLKVFQSATLWLAINRSPPVPLEMDSLKTVIDDSLTEELWIRIKTHLASNPQLSNALKNPNFIIDLHNEAVSHLTDIILDPESLLYTEFAPEFKILVTENEVLPCSYQYFDNTWKDTEYRSELEDIMSWFLLPAWRYDWPINNIEEFHSALSEYYRKILGDFASEILVNKIMGDMSLNLKNSDFTDFTTVVMYVINEHIENIKENFRVVYNKNHLKHFQNLPWWYKSKIVINYAQKNQFFVNPKMIEKPINLSAEDVINECNSFFQNESITLDKTYSKVSTEKINEIDLLTEQLEKSLQEQKSKNEIFEKELQKALEID